MLHKVTCERLEIETVQYLMDAYADLYFVAQLVTSARDHRDTSSYLIESTINSLNRRIHFLETLVQVQLLKTADRKKEEETNVFKDFKSPINFHFQSENVPSDSSEELDLPYAINDRLLWHFEYSSFRSNYMYHADSSSKEYKLAMDYLNSVYTNVSADLVKVDIKRRWLKPLLFGNKHFQLANCSILMSPGMTYPPEKFRESLTNDTYLFPLFPSSMLLATNIKLSIHTLFPYFVLPPLLRMSFDRHVFGGFGPFVFGQNFKSTTGIMKFSVSVRENNIEIHFPGTQLVGYMCDIVPKHPFEQSGGNNRGKRFARDNKIYREELNDRFKQWLSFERKEKVKTKFSEESIVPSSTISAYGIDQVEAYSNSTNKHRNLKTNIN